MGRQITFLAPSIVPTARPRVAPNLNVLEGVEIGDTSDVLRGKKVSFRVEWPSFKAFMTEMELLLRGRFGVAETDWWDLNSDDMSPYMQGGRSNVGRVSG